MAAPTNIKKPCLFCSEKISYIDYKDTQFLRRFISPHAKILPSRKTGTPASGRVLAATLEASIWSGNVIWLKRIAGIGIISSRKAQGNKTARKQVHPSKKITRPAITNNNETRDKKSSAPKTPNKRMMIPKRRIGKPQKDGAGSNFDRETRLCHKRYIENNGTKKPCEKFGSFHHWVARCARILE